MAYCELSSGVFIFHLQLIKFGLEDVDCRLRVSCLAQLPNAGAAFDAGSDADDATDDATDDAAQNSVNSSAAFRVTIRQALADIFRYLRSFKT